MGKNSHISWCDHTWNPWQGCHKQSIGCENCYMFAAKKRRGQNPNIIIRSLNRTFYAPTRWEDPARIFVCSWSDFFIEEADPWREDAWRVMGERASWHTYLILTKRPQRIAKCLPKQGSAWPWPHIWLGVSVESSDNLWRIDELLKTPAAVSWVSYEPLLEPIDPSSLAKGISWCVVGGESGYYRRPFKKEWAIPIRDYCIANNISFFFKQGSALYPGKDDLLERWRYKEWPQ